MPQLKFPMINALSNRMACIAEHEAPSHPMRENIDSTDHCFTCKDACRISQTTFQCDEREWETRLSSVGLVEQARNEEQTKKVDNTLPTKIALLSKTDVLSDTDRAMQCFATTETKTSGDGFVGNMRSIQVIDAKMKETTADETTDNKDTFTDSPLSAEETVKCPMNHSAEYQMSRVHGRFCNSCNNSITRGLLCYSCKCCAWDICIQCASKRLHNKHKRKHDAITNISNQLTTAPAMHHKKINSLDLLSPGIQAQLEVFRTQWKTTDFVKGVLRESSTSSDCKGNTTDDTITKTSLCPEYYSIESIVLTDCKALGNS